MKRKNLLVFLLVFALAVAVFSPALAQSSTQADLAQVRRATASFHNLSAAEAAGYGLVDGLNFCFDNPGVGGMGFHYINTNLLDAKVDLIKPEALVYAPDQNGKLRLAAVEYIVPFDQWKADHAPELFGRPFERNTALGVFALHAWIWKPNSLGMFNDWNPDVSCN